jgi:hypothetical protein
MCTSSPHRHTGTSTAPVAVRQYAMPCARMLGVALLFIEKSCTAFASLMTRQVDKRQQSALLYAHSIQA